MRRRRIGGRRDRTTRRACTRRSTVEDADPFRRQIDQVEQALWREDPALMLHVRRLQRIDTATVLTVFALLAAGSVLVTVGAATSTIAARRHRRDRDGRCLRDRPSTPTGAAPVTARRHHPLIASGRAAATADTDCEAGWRRGGQPLDTGPAPRWDAI